MNKLDIVERPRLRHDLPAFRPGDTLKVHVKVVEGTRERIQIFQGVVISRRGAGLSETFKVRKISFGVGVERTFPIHGPVVSTIEIVQHGRVRRAKLYYLRELTGRHAKIRERRTRIPSAAPAVAEPEVEPLEETPEAFEPELAAETVAAEATEATEAPEAATPEVAEPSEPAAEATAPEAEAAPEEKPATGE